MGVISQILINKAREGVHRAGQAVTGEVKYIVDEPTEYKEVTLSFLGKGKCHWTEKHGKSTHHYTGTEDYIINHVNICNMKPEEVITLNGEYQYPFEFYLPEDIPRSFKDRIGSITYTVELKFVKPSFFSFNKVFTAEIPVYNYVTPKAEGPVIFGLDKTLFSMFASEPPTINLKAEVDKTCLMPGENAHIKYTLRNDTDDEIIALKTELFCYMTYTANCERTKSISDEVKACEVESESIPERTKFEYKCVLPTLPELYSIDNSKVIKKEYRIKATVRLHMPHRNATVEMPILIGEQKGSGDAGIEAMADGAEPPSYWEAMCEEKDEEKSEK